MTQLLIFDAFTMLIREYRMSLITHFCGVKLLAWKSGCVKFLTNFWVTLTFALFTVGLLWKHIILPTSSLGPFLADLVFLFYQALSLVCVCLCGILQKTKLCDCWKLWGIITPFLSLHHKHPRNFFRWKMYKITILKNMTRILGPVTCPRQKI